MPPTRASGFAHIRLNVLLTPGTAFRADEMLSHPWHRHALGQAEAPSFENYDGPSFGP
jgi:hypothetical protein